MGVVCRLSFLPGDQDPLSALTMRGFITFLSLLGLALTSPMNHVDHETNEMVHDMGDAIEAGLMEPTEGEARALFISLTLTSTSSNCGRSGHSHEKRARIIALQNEVVTKNLTSTTTVMETAASTATFTVTLASCTTSGFTFAHPLCTAAATGK